MEIEHKVQTPDFNVVGEVALKRPEWAEKDAPDDKRPVVYVTASSTSPDLDCDRMSEKALGQMAAGFVGITIFLNHRYSWPEDVFGMVLRTRLVKRGEFLDLDLEVAVEPSNPRAMQSFEMMKNGTRAGVSVGVIVLKHYTSDEEQWDRQVVVIDEVLPLEASICGIPSNQRSWVRDAIKSLVDRGVLVLSCDAQGCRPWLKSAAASIVTKPGWDETEKEIRYRVRNPKDFEKDSFRRVLLKKDKPRVFAIMGKLTGETTMTIQALRFPKDDGWILADAKKWLKDHPDVTKAESEVEIMADVTDTDPVDDVDATPDEGGSLASDASVPEEPAPGCACGQHPEHMSEEDVELTAATRMLAPVVVASTPVEEPDEGDDEDGEEEDVIDAAVLTAVPDKLAASLAESLAEEVAEMEIRERVWRLHYAYMDAFWNIIEHTLPEDRADAVVALLAEYQGLLLEIVQEMPPPDEDDKDESWPVAAQSALDAYLATKGIVDSARAADDNVTEVTAKIAEFEATIVALTDERDTLTQKAEELQEWQDNATAEIKRFLDMAMPLKTKPNSGDSVRDAAQGLAKRLPEFSPFVISRLEK